MNATPTSRTTSYQSAMPPRQDSFAHVVRAEWTKFRTVRGWVVGLVLVAVVTVLFGLLSTSGTTGPCRGPNCRAPVGPDGEAVSDSFQFVHQPLAGDGTITARLTAFEVAGAPAGSALEPWSKAGLLVKESTRPGSRYAAIMVTGQHGVRMQHDYLHDIAGSRSDVSAGAPRWLRLTRAGETVTGYESGDGTDWTPVGTVTIDDLPPTVEVGLFVASPDFLDVEQVLGGTNSNTGPTRAQATFDEVDLDGAGSAKGWTGTEVGGDPEGFGWNQHEESGGTFTVTGSGDIAPAVGGQAFGSILPIEQTLVGVFAGLIVVSVIGTLFVSAEYRRGLMRTTLTATPRRGRVLAAKSVVIGAATFLVGLVAAVVAVVFGTRTLRSNGHLIYRVDATTEVRVIAGTAALLAVSAVLAVALGTVLRRSAGAVTAMIVAVVMPYILTVTSVLPAGASQWLLRVTPAAAFAVQQSLVRYAHVDNAYIPSNGFFPLAPWAGFAVLCAWTALALGAATIALRRRDA